MVGGQGHIEGQGSEPAKGCIRPLSFAWGSPPPEDWQQHIAYTEDILAAFKCALATADGNDKLTSSLRCALGARPRAQPNQPFIGLVVHTDGSSYLSSSWPHRPVAAGWGFTMNGISINGDEFYMGDALCFRTARPSVASEPPLQQHGRISSNKGGDAWVCEAGAYRPALRPTTHSRSAFSMATRLQRSCGQSPSSGKQQRPRDAALSFLCDMSPHTAAFSPTSGRAAWRIGDARTSTGQQHENSNTKTMSMHELWSTAAQPSASSPTSSGRRRSGTPLWPSGRGKERQQ